MKQAKLFNLEEFEQKIIKDYLISKGLDYKSFLNRFYERLRIEPLLFEGSDNLNIWEIIKRFETTIDEKFKKLNGAFYTPYFIVDYINRKVILGQKNAEIKVLDPACGSGIFLIDALFKLQAITRKTFKELVENNIYGLDIDPRAVKRTKILLALVSFENEGKIPERFNIYNGNSLNKNFLRQRLNNERFLAIVGNPPYIRIQNLDKETREIIRRYWRFTTGDTDLFIPFFELGIELLEEEGRLGYITPNSYFTTHAGKELRRFLQANRLIEEIVDFGHYQVFPGITTYTAITIISKKKKERFLLKKVEKEATIKNLDWIKGEGVPFNDLSFGKWILVKRDERRLIELIENAPDKLGDVADIRVGLATLSDKVYIIENPEERGSFLVQIFDGREFLIEKEITKEIIKASILKSERDILENRRRIIFPYKKVNGRFVIISEGELKSRFPKTYQYLLFCKEWLLSRDKGGKEYETWYAFGRTQGINTTFGRKILTPPMALEPTFVVCEKEEATFYSGYGIYPKISPFTDLYFLKKILMSQIMKIYIGLTAKSYQGGWKSYAKSFLKNFGLPKLTPEQVLFLKKTNDKKMIDEFLKKVYYEQGRNTRRLL